MLASDAKRKALCNLGHCKDQLQQPSPAGGQIPANSLVQLPSTFLKLREGAGLWRMLGSALGKSEKGGGGRLQSCHKRPEC